MNNKKGFTLAELLATIVVLSLVMSMAVVTISNVINRSRQGTYIETASNVINSVRQQLVSRDQLYEGDYEFLYRILESGGEESPLGGDITYRANLTNCPAENQIGDFLCKLNTQKTCSDTTTSFVRVTNENGVFKYSICLTAGAGRKYIGLSTEEQLLNSDYNDLIKG